MKIGYVLGKFYPPHNGHHHLIDTAMEQCDRVIIHILVHPQESIPGHERWAWMKMRHPGADVFDIPCDLDVDYESEEAWQRHIELINTYLPRLRPYGELVDVVYSSEEYGPELARRLNAEHRTVDLHRTTHPISSTAVRQDVPGNWQHLSAPVRRSLSQRVVLLGAESTGTTYLTCRLADHFEAPWVPEYGRLYSEGLGRDHKWVSGDLIHIAEQQLRLEDAIAEKHPVVFCDTDPFATAIWHEFLVDHNPEPIEQIEELAHEKPLYLLTCPDDIPWEDDGTRIGESFRQAMHERMREKLMEHDLNFVEVRGNRIVRTRFAVSVVEELLANAWRYNPPVTPPTVLKRNYG